MRIIDGDELVMWLSKWMTSSFGQEPTEETEAIRKVCDAVGDMVKDLAKDTGGDLISRVAAIDAIKTWGLIDGLAEGQAIEILADEEKLPSAQPEIIRCKDCRWWDKYGDDSGYCMAAKHGYFSEHWEISIRRTYKGDFYCADAEKKGDDSE